MAEKSNYSVSSLYTIDGGKATRKNPSCPKCGKGYFLAVHANRKTCGKCNYSEK